ncbi:MAG: hypothetical protein E7616_07675 [Ruminococcaceae bacterium]|nr:hypothetical protein [Oscillospiraceae bacterium]
MKKIAFIMAMLLMFTAVFSSCGNKKSNKLDPDTGEQQKEEVLTAKSYTLLLGDYCCVAGKTVTSGDSGVVEVVTSNLVRAVAEGSTTLTATDGKNTVTHTITVVSMDNVTLGSDYKTVSLKEYNKLFENELAQFMANYAKFTEVTDRTDVQKGDKVNIDYVGKMDGEEFEGGKGTYDLIIGSNSFIAGFEEGLIGVQNGATVDLNLTFPDPYPNNEELSGKPVVFTVTVNKISAPEAYTDEMVKGITGYETIAEFEEYLKKTIVTDMMFKQLTENSKVENIPQAIKDAYYNAYIEDMINYMASMGMTVTDKEQIINLMGYTEENFDKMVWETIGTTIEQDYIFYSFCEKNSILLTQEDYDENLAKYLEMYDCSSLEDMMSRYALTYDALYESFLYEKVMDILYKEADIVDDTQEENTENA